MLFITGDLHGKHDFSSKLNTEKFPLQKTLTKQDFVIIAGDFGLVWDDSKEDLYWRKLLTERNFTTLFVDGNHENFNLLDRYPVEHWQGGKVHFITESIIHLMRGQVFTLENMKFFTFGGAPSIDKYYRKPRVTWWEQEIPNNEEYQEGLDNLEKHNYLVDYIITHDCSSRMFDYIHSNLIRDMYKEKSQLTDYFDQLEERVKFKHWYFGHYHEDEVIDNSHTLLYNKVLRVL